MLSYLNVQIVMPVRKGENGGEVAPKRYPRTATPWGMSRCLYLHSILLLAAEVGAT